MNKRRWLIVGSLIGIILVGAVGYYLASPLIFDRTVDEALPFEIPDEAELAQMDASERESLEKDVLATGAAMPGKSMDESMPTVEEPVVLLQGQFIDVDSLHRGSGTATLFQLPEGGTLIRLEDFMVTNGPDLHVLLAEGTSPTDRDELGNYVDLGSLKGNLGNQNYEVPNGIDVDSFRSVVIYCVPFHVVFSTATFNP